MIRLWASIANKLGISQEHALLLHAYMRGWLNKVAAFQARIVVGEICERFELSDASDAPTYGQQLLVLRVLTPTEAEVFAGNYHGDPTEQAAEPGREDPDAYDQGNASSLGAIGRVRKITRGPSSGPDAD